MRIHFDNHWSRLFDSRYGVRAFTLIDITYHYVSDLHPEISFCIFNFRISYQFKGIVSPPPQEYRVQ